MIRRSTAHASILVALLTAWEVAGERSWFVRLLVSSPSRLAIYFGDHWRQLLEDLFHTAFVAAGGLTIALLIGAFIALVGLRFQSLAPTIEGTATVAQAIPLVVFAPITVILFETGYASQMALASIMAVFPCVVGFMSALRASQAEFAELLLLYKAPFRARVFDVYLAHSLPSLIVTIRVAAALAVLGAVIAEFTGSASGLGRNIFLGTVRLDPELIMSALLLTSALGVAIHLALAWLARRSAWWR